MFINTTPDTPKGEKSGDIFLSFSLELSAANMLWPFQNTKLLWDKLYEVHKQSKVLRPCGAQILSTISTETEKALLFQ